MPLNHEKNENLLFESGVVNERCKTKVVPIYFQRELLPLAVCLANPEIKLLICS
jgi:hypothetical protein